MATHGCVRCTVCGVWCSICAKCVHTPVVAYSVPPQYEMNPLTPEERLEQAEENIRELRREISLLKQQLGLDGVYTIPVPKLDEDDRDGGV